MSVEEQRLAENLFKKLAEQTECEYSGLDCSWGMKFTTVMINEEGFVVRVCCLFEDVPMISIRLDANNSFSYKQEVFLLDDVGCFEKVRETVLKYKRIYIQKIR